MSLTPIGTPSIGPRTQLSLALRVLSAGLRERVLRIEMRPGLDVGVGRGDALEQGSHVIFAAQGAIANRSPRVAKR